VVEIHHQNLGAHAGQKRLGDEFTIPLCTWHHRGIPRLMNSKDARKILGPSLARESKAFRRRFGSDRKLLRITNSQLLTNYA
jgi:hypothetical protein